MIHLPRTGRYMVRSTINWPALVFALLVLVMAPAGDARAGALVFKATEAGKQTLDQGEGGGNPFASALIELLGRQALRLAELPGELRRSTTQKSNAFQSPDVPAVIAEPGWSVRPGTPGEIRRALVLVVSDYALSGGAPSLPGARHDAGRIAAALQTAGFQTEVAIDLDLAAMRDRLAKFRSSSLTADAALIYVTGHGVEVGGRIHVIPGDYPVSEGNASLPRKALALDVIAAAAAAKRVNLVFYGGCRDDPMAP